MSDECIELDQLQSDLIDEMHDELTRPQQERAAPRGCSGNAGT